MHKLAYELVYNIAPRTFARNFTSQGMRLAMQLLSKASCYVEHTSGPPLPGTLTRSWTPPLDMARFSVQLRLLVERNANNLRLVKAHLPHPSLSRPQITPYTILCSIFPRIL